MKKLIIAALAAAALITCTITVSAKCGPCAGTDCARREYCMEECPNDWQCDGMYTHNRMMGRGHHGRYCSNDYCQYR